jgi:hypothetical protein
VVSNQTGSMSCPNGAVDILAGNGNGTFQPPQEYCSGGSIPMAVAVADVNRDGKADLIVANGGAGGIAVLLGNGDGTFQPAANYDACGPISVAVADLNRDGNPDLVVGCFSNAVGILLGRGDGSFISYRTYDSSGFYVNSVTVGDVNGDGIPDVIVPNEFQCASCQNGSVGVLLGNGDGTFRPAMSYSSGGIAAWSTALADVNDDGKTDLVVANYGNDTLGVLLGNGNGTFQPAVIYPSGAPGPVAIATADVNRDGRPDLLVADWYGYKNNEGLVGILLNNTPFCTTPPVITLSAAPKFLWPPNGAIVPVTISGAITDNSTGCTIKAAAYTVQDEYGEMQPTGSVTLGSRGAFSFTVLLQASRLGIDLDGRLYTIAVRASNNAGKTGLQFDTVVVPHDQGH